MLLSKPEIARKPKPAAVAKQNGVTNGTHSTTNNVVLRRRKRDSSIAEVEERPAKKRVKMPSKSIPTAVEAIVVDDAGDGAIVIDDD
jgi:hypothetical protein